MLVYYKKRSMFSSQQQHIQMSMLPALEGPYKESEMVFVLWLSSEAGLRCLSIGQGTGLIESSV